MCLILCQHLGALYDRWTTLYSLNPMITIGPLLLLYETLHMIT